MDDLLNALDGWIRDTAMLLSRNYETYWPNRGQTDPSERDLTTALAAVMVRGSGCSIFSDVPTYGRSKDRIDLVALLPGMDACVLVRSKNVESNKIRGQVIADARKMRRFSFKPTLRDGQLFSRRVLRVALWMGWTGSNHSVNPLEKSSYLALARIGSDPSRNVRVGYSEICRTCLAEPYSHQWLLYIADAG